MFGISMAEFLIIGIVAMAVIPAKDWPKVFKALARGVKFIRELIWKITDATNEIQEQIEREVPINEIIEKTNIDVFAKPMKKATRNQEPGTRRKKK
jgi:Sec-independent protein translocase protein TatA